MISENLTVTLTEPTVKVSSSLRDLSCLCTKKMYSTASSSVACLMEEVDCSENRDIFVVPIELIVRAEETVHCCNCAYSLYNALCTLCQCMTGMCG